MKVIDLINLYRLKDMTRIEIRKDNWFVLETNYENIPEEIKNKEVCDFCFGDDDKLVVNFSSDEVEKIEEDKEIEELVYKSWSSFSDDVQEVYNKINELIKAVNSIKKGN